MFKVLIIFAEDVIAQVATIWLMGHRVLYRGGVRKRASPDVPPHLPHATGKEKEKRRLLLVPSIGEPGVKQGMPGLT
jgi:hypothetical protein